MVFESKLRAGTHFRGSVVGHKHFVYPGLKSDTLIEDTVCKRTHYVGGGTKVAVVVPESVVKHDGTPDKDVIIWVEKAEIL